MRHVLGRAVLVIAEIGALMALMIVAALVVVAELIRYWTAQSRWRRRSA